MPLDSQTLPLEMAALIPGQVRIAWKIAGATGQGPWFHADDRPMLQKWCDEYNSTYGAGTHRVETCGDCSKDYLDLATRRLFGESPGEVAA